MVKSTGISVDVPLTICCFTTSHSTPRDLDKIVHIPLGGKQIKRLEDSMTFSFLGGGEGGEGVADGVGGGGGGREFISQEQICTMNNKPTFFVYCFQPIYSEPHVLRKLHIRLWGFQTVTLSPWTCNKILLMSTSSYFSRITSLYTTRYINQFYDLSGLLMRFVIICVLLMFHWWGSLDNVEVSSE